MNMDNGEKKPNFAETLQRYRTRLGLSMRKFAEKIGVSPAYISRLEYGTYPAPENEVLDNIIKGLNLTPQEEREVLSVFSWTGFEPPQNHPKKKALSYPPIIRFE